MADTLNYYDEIIECMHCGEKQTVQCVSEYDTEQGETFNDIVAGSEYCAFCGGILTL